MCDFTIPLQSLLIGVALGRIALLVSINKILERFLELFITEQVVKHTHGYSSFLYALVRRCTILNGCHADDIEVQQCSRTEPVPADARVECQTGLKVLSSALCCVIARIKNTL